MFHIEPRLVRHPQDERPAYCSIRRSDRAVRQHVDRHAARDAALLRQQHPFGDASICTATLMFAAIFIDTARPLPPT